MRYTTIFCALASAMFASAANTSQANLISLFETQFDVDFVTSGVGGLRGTGTGEITLSGISGPVSQAYLYWHGPTDSLDPNFNANISFNGTAIMGTNIGFSDDNFWSQDNSQAYRADITSLVAGNGTFILSGLQPDHSNGASILAFFDDGDDTNNRDVVLFDGNDANFANVFDPLGWDITLSGINYTSGTGELVFTVSDGQLFTDTALIVNGTTIAGPGPVFQGDTVPATPGTTVTNGALWDVKSFDVTSLLSPGSNTLNISHGTNQDALSVINVAVSLPAGAAPPTSNVPEPASALLFTVGLVSFGFIARNRRRRM